MRVGGRGLGTSTMNHSLESFELNSFVTLVLGVTERWLGA